MAESDIQSTVVAAIVSICRCDPSKIDPGVNLFELGIDSLGMAAIATYVQASLETELTQEQLIKLYQAGSVREIVLAMSG